MLFDTQQIQQTLEEYYGKELQGTENIGISDVAYIEEVSEESGFLPDIQSFLAPFLHCGDKDARRPRDWGKKGP